MVILILTVRTCKSEVSATRLAKCRTIDPMGVFLCLMLISGEAVMHLLAIMEAQFSQLVPCR